jgi:hypothetical protein
MSESKFTPGPWKKFSRWNDRYLAVIDSTPDRDGAVVANCICHVALTNDDCVANARLIAAAPEMLAALHELITLKDTKPHDYEQRKIQAWRAAREAIEKAIGEV